VVVALLELLASPLVALPPVVLPLELASPENAPCRLRFRTPTVLVLVTVEVLVDVFVALLVELGPVLLTLFDWLAEPALTHEALELLLTDTLVLELALLLALPLVALPPVVLPLEVALPLADSCPLMLPTRALLVLVVVVVFVSVFVDVFVELGPVLSIDPLCATAIPVVRLVLTAAAASNRSNFFIVTPSFNII